MSIESGTSGKDERRWAAASRSAMRRRYCD